MQDLYIEDWPLPYVDRLETRRSAAIDLVVIHCTELPDLATAREYGERTRHPQSATGNSGHYYIDRDGRILRFVDELHIAHHVVGWNARSIGIELINRGRFPHWADSRHQQFSEVYPEPQIEALLALLEGLRGTHPQLRWIAGHADLDQRLEPASDEPSQLLRRRLDPGPLFPWSTVLARCALTRLPAEGSAATAIL